LVQLDALHIELDSMEMSEKEKKEIKKLIDASMYHTILDAILSELSEEDKKVFLTHLMEEDNVKIWKLLNHKIDNIEDKIKQAADDIKKELKSDIASSKSS
jgi:hypothetical protein